MSGKEQSPHAALPGTVTWYDTLATSLVGIYG